jgi:hypothetical protein
MGLESLAALSMLVVIKSRHATANHSINADLRGLRNEAVAADGEGDCRHREVQCCRHSNYQLVGARRAIKMFGA